MFTLHATPLKRSSAKRLACQVLVFAFANSLGAAPVVPDGFRVGVTLGRPAGINAVLEYKNHGGRFGLSIGGLPDMGIYGATLQWALSVERQLSWSWVRPITGIYYLAEDSYGRRIPTDKTTEWGPFIGLMVERGGFYSFIAPAAAFFSIEGPQGIKSQIEPSIVAQMGYLWRL